jgi:hypothetical protein
MKVMKGRDEGCKTLQPMECKLLRLQLETSGVHMTNKTWFGPLLAYSDSAGLSCLTATLNCVNQGRIKHGRATTPVNMKQHSFD